MALERDMVEQKIMANQQQQQLRSLTLCLMNFPEVIGEKEDNYAALRARVYDVVLKPLLTAAKAAKEITSVPQMATVIDSCFRPFNASATSSKGPPHVIIKVTTKPLKIAILRQKKNMVKLTTSPDGDKRFILVEDLIQDTHKVLTALSKSTGPLSSPVRARLGPGRSGRSTTPCPRLSTCNSSYKPHFPLVGY